MRFALHQSFGAPPLKPPFSPRVVPLDGGAAVVAPCAPPAFGDLLPAPPCYVGCVLPTIQQSRQ
eukprot:3226213-Pyramimonas_sp.AAC.1